MLKTSLRYFVAVARHGSIRAACAELNVAQSAVSRQLQGLEREIGSILLERRPRGIVLTQAGELLLGFGLNASSDRQALTAGVLAIRELRSGHVGIAAIQSMVPNVLPGAIQAFRAEHSAITFAVEVATTDEAVARVRDGDADVGIGFSPALGPDLEIAHRSQEPLLAVMAPSHPLASRKIVTTSDVAGFPLALSPADNPARVMFETACRASGISPVAAFESNSLELLRRYAETGDGVTVLLKHTVAISLARQRLVAVPFRDLGLTGTIDVFIGRRRTLPAASKRFIATLAEALGAG